MGGIGVSSLCYLLRDLEDTITTELKDRKFFALRADLTEFYDEEDKPVFGEGVPRQFDKAIHDIAEARRCFALERWDASVHHLELAIEQAVENWAADVHLTTRLSYDLKNMEQILQAADRKQIENIAETAGHFCFIKNPSRNHAAPVATAMTSARQET